MKQARKDQILAKLAEPAIDNSFPWPWEAERARVQREVQRTVANARRNFQAGGTVEQRQVNDDVGTIPANLTLKDRLKEWTTRQPKVEQPWSPGQGVAPIFSPPANLGNPRANRGLEVLKKNQMSGFGPPSDGYIDCSSFACDVAQTPRMTTDSIYRDARGTKKNWVEIPHHQMRPGDFLVYPRHRGPDGSLDYGHIAMYGGAGRFIDSSASGSGSRYRQAPGAFYERAAAEDGLSPIVVRAKKDMSAPFTPVPPPGAGTPLVFQEGQYTPKKYLATLGE